MSRRRPNIERPRAYKGTKFYDYLSALPLDEIKNILTQKGHIERKERDLDTRQIKTIKSTVSNLNIEDAGLFGTVFYKIQKPTGQGTHYWKVKTFDFLICRDPSVLIIHGSRSLMRFVVPQLERAIYSLDEDDEDTPPPYFVPHSFDTADGKYIIKKISKRIEAQNVRNIIYEPYFKKLSENLHVRGGQSFYRRDRTSAILDDEFCYLFEKCGYWEPSLLIQSCGGITSPQVTEDIKIKINSDFSFKFSHNIPKLSLDSFWNTIVLPIIRENNYADERTECVENARAYSAMITPAR